MRHNVFLSYSRQTSHEHARALFEALGGPKGAAFLDESAGTTGEQFSPVLLDALLGARVVVIFADDAYFQRFFCLWELELALSAFLALAPGASEEAKTEALANLIIVLPNATDGRKVLDTLPARLRTTDWPTVAQKDRLRSLVEERLQTQQLSLAERLRSLGRLDEIRTRFLEASARPSPVNLAGFTPLYPLQWPESLGASFIGRSDELWWIHFVLHTLRGEGNQGAALVGALEAGGGFGKTTLALEYVHRFGRKYYPGGIFLVRADLDPDSEAGASQLEEQFYGILQELTPGVPPLPTYRQEGRSVRKDLERALHAIPADRPVLYVVDNVPETRGEAAPRPPDTWCPAIGKVSLLVTSRARVSVGWRGTRALRVEALSQAAAVRLLTHGVQSQELREEDWQRIAAWVGHLPLALALLNRTLCLGGMTARELLDRMKVVGPSEEADRQAEALRGLVPDEACRGVSQTLLISYEKLSEDARKSARLLAFLSPDPIPLELLHALGPELDSLRIRNALSARSFITPVHGGTVSFFGTMHRVLADFLRRQTPEPQEALQRLCAALLTILDWEACTAPQQWPLLNACVPHAEQVFRALGRITQGSAPQSHESRLELALRMSRLFRAAGLVRRGRELLEEVFSQAKASLGHEHATTITAMQHLASTLREHGHLARARSLQEEVLAHFRRTTGDSSLPTLVALDNLALTIREQGDLRGARERQERVVKELPAVAGEESARMLTALSNLAHTLGKQGDFSNARATYERARELALRIHGEEHDMTLTVTSGLATAMRQLGDLGSAQQLCETVLEIRSRRYGEEHPKTVLSMGQLASILRERGDPKEARRIQERVLEVQKRVLGEEHPETLTSTNNLAVSLAAQGEHEAARKIRESLLIIYRRQYGDEHPNTLKALLSLASSHAEQGDAAGARKMQEQVVEGFHRILGPEHPDTLLAMLFLAMTLHSQQDITGARALEEKVLEIEVRRQGPHHPDTTTAAWNLFQTLWALKELVVAQDILNRYLVWLVDRDPRTLEGVQQEVRHIVANLLKAGVFQLSRR
jgi:tetratricopeptide (TPR) repeat protein